MTRDYLYGLLTVPALWVAYRVVTLVAGLLYRACRDTWRLLAGAELLPGWSRWWWPYLIVRQFGDCLRDQWRAKWNGYETEVA